MPLSNLSISVPAGGVAAGHSVVVEVATDVALGSISVSDSAGNTYSDDADVSSTLNLVRRTAVFSSHGVHPIPSGGTITVTFPPTAVLKAASASEFSGLVGTVPVDMTSTQTNGLLPDGSPTSGLTPPTSQPNELVVGAIGAIQALPTGFTPASGYNGLPSASTAILGNNINVFPEYQIASSVGAFQANGTLSPISLWAAAVVTYKADTATHLSITSQGSPTVGAPFAVTVTALDANNQPVPGYTGTVHFTSSDGVATLPANYTFTPADNGSHTFTVVFHTQGNQSFTATDQATGTITGSATLAVATNATHLGITPQGNPTVGAPFTVTVTALDANNQPANTYIGTVHFASSDSNATLPGDYTFTPADGGSHTFTIVFHTQGSQSLTVADRMTGAINGSINVPVGGNATVVTHLSLTFSGNPTAGVPTNVIVCALDGNNQPVGTYTGTVHFTSSDPTATLPADYTFTPADNGCHTFSVVFRTPGNQTLSVNDTATGSVVGSATGNVSPSGSTQPPILGPRLFAVGGAPGEVQIYRVSDGSLVTKFQPFGPAYTGGVSVAVGDVNGDGFQDVVVGATIGNPHVKVYDGKAIASGSFNPDVNVLASFFAYELQFNVGANVAVGDVNGDGFADIVTGASAGNPHVKVYDGRAIAKGSFDSASPNASLLTQFFAYGLQFNVGVTVAVGDVNGDGAPDIITGASIGNPHVKVYDGKAIANGSFNLNSPDASLLTQFFAYDLQFNIGVDVGAADFSGKGQVDILTGPTSGAPHYRVVPGNATGIKPPALFEGIPSDFAAGVQVGG